MLKKLAALVLASMLPAAALAATDSVTQTVDASVAESIEISIDSATESLALVAGTTTTADAVLSINSTVGYTIVASADSDAAKVGSEAKLFEHNGTAYVASGRKVDSVLQVGGIAGTAAGTPASLAGISTTGATIFTGTQPESGGTVTARLSQSTPWGTPALAAGTYRMVITYTATTSAI